MEAHKTRQGENGIWKSEKIEWLEETIVEKQNLRGIEKGLTISFQRIFCSKNFLFPAFDATEKYFSWL